MKKKLIIFGGIGLLVVIIAAVAAIFLLKGEESSTEEGQETVEEEMAMDAMEIKEAMYHDLHPAFVANFAQPSDQNFMQVYVVAMSFEKEVIEALEMHTPAVRNAILLHLSSKTSDDVKTAEGKEMLRNELLEKVNKVIEQKTGKTGVEDILFTKFVTQ